MMRATGYRAYGYRAKAYRATAYGKRGRKVTSGDVGLEIPALLRQLLFHDNGVVSYQPYYTEEEWLGNSHRLNDYSLGVGSLRNQLLGYGYDFNGTDDTLTLPPTTSEVNNLTVCIWVNPDTLTAYAPYFTKASHFGIRKSPSSEVAFEFVWFDGVNAIARKVNTTVVGKWTHLALVIASNQISSVYIDGLVTPSTFVFSVAFVRSVSNNILIGKTPGEVFNGKAYDARIYNAALSADEILYIKSHGQSGTAPSVNPVGHWPLQEQSGTTAYDISGNGKHGTITNATTSGVGSIHQPNAGVTLSYGNEYGYTLGHNVVARSQEFTNTVVWTSTRLTITTDATTAPNGSLTAYAINQANGQTSSGTIRQTITVTGAANFSVYAKPNGKSFVILDVSSSTAGQAWFDITNGQIGNVGASLSNATLSLDEEGFYRCSVDFTGSGTVIIYVRLADTNSSLVVNDDSEGVYLWGAQVTTGSGVKPYQQTLVSSNANAIIPAISATHDALDGLLTYTGRAPHDGLIKGWAWQGDGSAVYVDLGSPIIPATADFELEIWYYHSANNTTRVQIVSQTQDILPNNRINIVGNSNITATGVPGSLLTQVNADGTSQLLVLENSLVGEEWHHISMERIGSFFTITCTVNGIRSTGTITANPSVIYSGRNTWVLGHATGSLIPNPGSIGLVSITTGGLTTTYSPLKNTRNVAVLKSDGTYSIISNAVKNGTDANLYTLGDGSWRLPEVENGAYYDVGNYILYPAAPGASVACNGSAISSAGAIVFAAYLTSIPYTLYGVLNADTDGDLDSAILIFNSSANRTAYNRSTGSLNPTATGLVCSFNSSTSGLLGGTYTLTERNSSGISGTIAINSFTNDHTFEITGTALLNVPKWKHPITLEVDRTGGTEDPASLAMALDDYAAEAYGDAVADDTVNKRINTYYADRLGASESDISEETYFG